MNDEIVIREVNQFDRNDYPALPADRVVFIRLPNGRGYAEEVFLTVEQFIKLRADMDAFVLSKMFGL